MKSFLLFHVLVAVSSFELNSLSRGSDWNNFKVDHQKSFDSPADEAYREEVFWNNLRTIARHNERRNSSFKLGINQFADLTSEEITRIFEIDETERLQQIEKALGAKSPKSLVRFTDHSDFTNSTLLLRSFDWRDRGAVSKVKNQRNCGACYAMAPIAAIESHYFIRHKKVISLSEQEIIDCSQEYLSFGCKGGVDFRVFEYVKDKGGISADSDYKFESKEGECRGNEKKFKVAVDGFGLVYSRTDRNIFKKALIERGPLMVAMDSNLESFMRYSSGIFHDINCNEDYLNHAVLLVGYGSENGEEFWIVKNSFGESWGEDGYIRVAMDRDCGITHMGVFPVMTK